MIGRTGALLLAPLLLAVAAGCVRAPPPDLSRNPADLLAQVRRAQARVASCSGSARLSLSGLEVGGSLDAWVAAETSGRLRVDLFDFFGNPAATLVASGGRFALLDLREGVLYRGEDRPEVLSRIVSVPLGTRDLARVLCGSVAILEGQPVTAEPGDGAVLLEIAGPAGRQVLAVEEEASIRRASFLPGPGGGKGWQAEFSVFRHPSGVRFPTEVGLTGGGAGLSLRWTDDLQVNVAIDGGLFLLEAPGGVRVIELGPDTSVPALGLPIRPATPARS